MARWTGIILALPTSRADGMQSRLPTYVHPIAGRPLVWHAAAALAEAATPPTRIVVLSEGDLSPETFDGVPVPTEVLSLAPGGGEDVLEEDEDLCLVVHASAVIPAATLTALLEARIGSWAPGGGGRASAIRSDRAHLREILDAPEPFDVPSGPLPASRSLDASLTAPIVGDRAEFAATSERIRRQLIQNLMAGGVSFLLPDSVLVDVDVRIGRDSIVYPGVVLEGTTTVGDETVIGPGCRIIDSWVGSGVELKGWNFISHTSIRNRAILEPYVRRGFD